MNNIVFIRCKYCGDEIPEGFGFCCDRCFDRFEKGEEDE